jgi:hypothetical protein
MLTALDKSIEQTSVDDKNESSAFVSKAKIHCSKPIKKFSIIWQIKGYHLMFS